MNALDRRKQMIEYICQVRHTTYERLCYEFSISKRTAIRDVSELTLSYPIDVKHGKHGGGIYIEEGYYLGKQYLTEEQKDLLNQLKGSVNKNQAAILQSILNKFARPERRWEIWQPNK